MVSIIQRAIVYLSFLVGKFTYPYKLEWTEPHFITLKSALVFCHEMVKFHTPAPIKNDFMDDIFSWMAFFHECLMKFV